jgi:hypothetical protein
MNMFDFVYKIWRTLWIIRHYQLAIDHELRDRFDEFPCRDCDIPEGMWW